MNAISPTVNGCNFCIYCEALTTINPKRSLYMAVSIRLDPEIEQRLDELVSQTGRTKSYYLGKVN
jgi:hypothetical protein